MQRSEIFVQNRVFCLPYLHLTPPLGGSRRNIATPFGIEKLEWCGYPMVKKFRRYVYSFWHDPRTWQTKGRTDRRTDRHRLTAIAALMHSIARQKLAQTSLYLLCFKSYYMISLTRCHHKSILDKSQFVWPDLFSRPRCDKQTPHCKQKQKCIDIGNPAAKQFPFS